MLLIVILLLVGVTAAILLWPLLRRAERGERRAILLSIIAVLIAIPAGAILLYAFLGSPDLATESAAPRTERDSASDLAAEAAQAARAVHNDPSVESWNRFGNILFRMRNYKAAAKAFEQAARLATPEQKEEAGGRK